MEGGLSIMKKRIIIRVCLVLGFLILAIGATTYYIYNLKISYRASVQFINEIDDVTLVQLMINDTDNYRVISSKVVKFAPETFYERLQKLDAMKKMTRCLESAIEILKGGEKNFQLPPDTTSI